MRVVRYRDQRQGLISAHLPSDEPRLHDAVQDPSLAATMGEREADGCDDQARSSRAAD